jgi:multiple sugar transport system substrate-binding protein
LGSAKNFHILPCPQLHAELLANSSRETSQYDVVAVKFPWIGEMTEAGVLRPLDSLLGDETKRPVVPRRSEFGYWKGRFYGLPLYATMNLLAIRKDLFADAGLNPPKTLDDLLLAARSLSTPERAAIVWDAARGMPVAHSFMFFIGAFGTPVVNVVGGRIAGRIEEANLEELIPMVASDAGRAALDFMHRLRELSPPGILDLAWDQSLEIFLTGGAAMSICWSNRAARFEYDPRSVVGQRVMHMPLPTRYGSAPSVPLGGFLLSIPANLPESRVQQAAEAIQLVTSVDEISRGELPIVPNFGLSADPEMRVAMGIAHSARKWGAGGLLHSWQRPAIPQYYVIETILGEEIYAALAGEKSDRDALRDASDRMEQALAETAGSRAFLLDAAQ